jgi:uncharacterized protein YfaS (alpha-2-macroglobulin family)
MKMPFIRALAALALIASGCTCGDKPSGTDRELVTPGEAPRQGELQPLPEAPELDVPRDALPGADGELAVVTARPQGPVRGEVRPAVTFSKPVKTLGDIEGQRASDRQKPFARIEPSLPGEWRWLGSASAEFVPQGQVPYATSFTVIILEGLRAVDGSTLAEAHTFTFSTPAPELQDVSPVRGYAWLKPDTTFKLLFNQPVKDLAQHARLEVEGEPSPQKLRLVKTTSVADERRAAQGERQYERLDDETRGFRNQQTRYELAPEKPLPLGRAVTLHVGDGLRGEQGPLTLERALQLSWRTYGPMTVQRAAFCGDHHCPSGPLLIYTSNEPTLASLRERLEVSPPVEIDWEASSVWAPSASYSDGRSGPRASLSGAFKPGTSYSVTLEPGTRDVHGEAVAQPFTARLQTHDLRPALYTGGENALVEAARGPSLPVELVNLESLDVAIWNFSAAEAAQFLAQGAHQARANLRSPDFMETVKPAVGRNEVGVHSVSLAPVFGRARTGLALVRLTSDALAQGAQQGHLVLVQVTDLAAHLKLGPSRSAIWVTELSTGKGAAGAQVSILDSRGAVRWTGLAGDDGLLDAPGAEELNLGQADEWSTPFALVTASRGADTGISSSEWHQGVAAWDFNLPQGWEGKVPQPSGFVFTERGIYRPGDTVHVKGLARYRSVGALKAPSAGSQLAVTVRDSRGEDQSVARVQVTKFGTFSLDAVIPKEAPTGWYQVEARGKAPGGELFFNGSFRVEEYRAPQFKVDVLPKQSQLVAGEALEATVLARYLFGGAMSEVPVRWSVHRTSHAFSPEGMDDFIFRHDTWWWDDNEPGDHGGFVGSGEALADAKGGFTVRLAAVEAPGERAYQYTVEAEVTDVNRQTVANRATVTVHPSALYVGVRPPLGFRKAAEPVSVDGVVTDVSGKRVGGRPFEVEIVRRTWKSIRQKDAGGGLTTVSEPSEERVHLCTLRSDGKAPVPCTFTPPESGFFIVRASVADDHKRRHAASTGLYVTGEGFVAWQRNDTERIDLVPDKTRYEVGDVARVLVKSPYPKARALVTVEREGVLERRIVEFEGSAGTVDVPITEAMVPNVFLGVLVVRPRLAQGGLETGEDPGRPAVRLGLVKLPVERSAKRLSVEVKTDREAYRPGEEVTVRLAVKDARGAGASAEVTVYAVDEAVLRLTDYQTPDPIASIFPERPLSVRTGEPLLHLVRKRSYGEKGEEEGGGGAEENDGSGFRSNFKTTAFYKPDVLTAANGTATVRFKLPDNLTGFRVMAVAVAADDRFGSGERALRVSKPLLALPALPRFARVGDQFEAGVVVHAHGSGGGEVTVTAQVENATLNGPAERRVDVEEGRPREVRFSFTADRAGIATFRFKVARGADTDGVEQKIPVELPVGFETVATYGDTRDQRVEGLVPPEGARPELGGLEVTLASTALGNFGEGFRQLVEYPYGCLEQQTSRLVPFVALRELGPKLGIPWTFVADDPDLVIRQSLASILKLQGDDGAFRYWPDNACPHSFSSAYATLALHRARAVGFAVDDKRLGRAQDYVRQVASGQCSPCERSCPDETRVFAAWVLARSGRPQASHYGELFNRRDTLSLFSRALLADAMFVGGGNKEQAKKLMQELLNHAKESPKGLHFEEVHAQSYATLRHSDTRTTGAVLQTLAAISPDHPYVSKIAHYLTGVRQGGKWRSTQEAAFSLMGLTELVRVKEKEDPNFVARVLLGDTAVAEQSFVGRTTSLVSRKVPMAELLQAKGERKLTFKKEGPGVLYYGATLRYAPTEVPMKPLENGLFVQRWFEPFEGGGQAVRFRAGELVRVRLRVASNQERHFAAFEVPLPAGLEPVDTSLATSARLGRRPREESRGEGYEYEDEEDPEPDNPWLHGFWSPFNHIEQRDSRVLLFADHLPPGVHTASFVARATTPGEFLLKPAHGELMYEPEVFGRSGGGSFEVQFAQEVSRR